MNPQNQLLCMLYTFSQCHYLYRPPIDCYDLVVDINDIEKEIVKSAKDLFEEKISLENGTSPLLSRSFSIGLCYINKLVKKGLTHGVMFEPRFLILSCTRDIVEQYIPLINCIFYCKRNDMIIDCCILHEEDSNFLQIASYITGGSYVKIKYKDALLQYLITSFFT